MKIIQNAVISFVFIYVLTYLCSLGHFNPIGDLIMKIIRRDQK